MAKDQRVTFYTTPEIKEALEEEVERSGLSESSWCEQAVEEKLAEVTIDRTAEAVSLEERMNRMLGQTEDRIDSLLEESLASHSLDAVYSRAVWELISQNFSPKQRKEALETAVEQVETEANESVSLDVDAALGATQEARADDAGAPATETHPETTTDGDHDRGVEAGDPNNAGATGEATGPANSTTATRTSQPDDATDGDGEDDEDEPWFLP